MLENSSYYLTKEAQRWTGQALTEANRDQLAHTTQCSETTDSISTPDYRQNDGAWWARVWLDINRLFRPSNAKI